LAPKKSFPHRKTCNKEKRLFYFGLGILLPIPIQLLDFENRKIGSPYCTYICCDVMHFLPIFHQTKAIFEEREKPHFAPIAKSRTFSSFPRDVQKKKIILSNDRVIRYF
jgi:hypothetical protein